MEYAAFISYRQVEPDRTFARRLHRRLESYVVASSRGGKRTRFGKCFLDDQDMKAGDIAETLRESLLRARALIVICSPATPESRWVEEEITAFAAGREQPLIVPVLIDGTAEDSVPPALAATGLASEPVDARGKSADVFREIVARALGVPISELRAAERARRRMVLTFATAAALILACGAGAWRQWMRTDAYQRYRVLRDAPIDAVLTQDQPAAVTEWMRALMSRGQNARVTTVLQLAHARLTERMSASAFDPAAVLPIAEEAEKLGFRSEASLLWGIVDRRASVLDRTMFNMTRVHLAASLANAGRSGDALRHLRDVVPPDGQYNAAPVAETYIRIGRPDEALALLHACCSSETPILTRDAYAEAAAAFTASRNLAGFREASRPFRARSKCPECWEEVERFVAAGDVEVVRGVLATLPNARRIDSLQADVVEALAAAGRYAEAESYARKIARRSDRSIAIASLATTAVQKNALDVARRTVDAIDDAEFRCHMLLRVAVSSAEHGPAAFNPFASLLQKTCSDDVPDLHDLGELAAAALLVGAQPVAERAWRQIIAQRDLEESWAEPRQLLPLAEALGRLGSIEEANAIWQRAWDETNDDLSLNVLRESLARGGRLQRALDLKRTLPDGTTAGKTYDELVQLVRLHAHLPHRTQLETEILRRRPEQQVSLFIALSDVLSQRENAAALDYARRALVAAARVDQPSTRQTATAGAALRLARLGELRLAREACSAEACLPLDRLQVFTAIYGAPAR